MIRRASAGSPGRPGMRAPDAPGPAGKEKTWDS